MDACHSSAAPVLPSGSAQIALVGHPNVGKSVLFGYLTGRYTTVSNYPGTTVEVCQGAARFRPGTVVIDTPGIISLPPRSEDEQVTTRVLFDAALHTIVQVGDAKNPRRTLLLAVQLAELGVPLVLALNMVDEAEARGVVVNASRLAAVLGVPVVPTVAPRRQGLPDLTAALTSVQPPDLHIQYPDAIEQAIGEVLPLLPPASCALRAVALFWLSGDSVVEAWLAARLNATVLDELRSIRTRLQEAVEQPVTAAIQQGRVRWLNTMLPEVMQNTLPTTRGFADTLARLATHPLWGLPVLAVVLYLLYWFVGVFGASVLVGWLEQTLFGSWINPWLTDVIQHVSPSPVLTDLLVGEYGLWTMGVTYAVALLLPIVITFFLAFGVLEDSGYLPRLAALSNRLFAIIGLNGKAVLPMVLGLGCVTMATMTTRILERRRDRLLVTLLLALAVPCSAQLGVVLGMLASISFVATLIWGGIVLGILLTVGWLAARFVPGERSLLLLELPPLRVPRVSNVLLKTLAHLEWYLKEAIPLFLLGTFVLWILQVLGVLPLLIRISEPLVVSWLGLPREASAAFLMGFLRRDFAATGLFALQAQGIMTPRQVVVAMVTVTLFIPCVASVIMIAKERGTRTAVAMVTLIFPLAWLVGGVLERVLRSIGWGA